MKLLQNTTQGVGVELAESQWLMANQSIPESPDLKFLSFSSSIKVTERIKV